MKPNDLVLVHSGPPGQNMHVVARYLQPVDPNGERVWLDMNMGGVHLPQMYRLSDVERVWDAAPHGFCLDCKGFGIPEGSPSDVGTDQRVSCSSCGGSGRPMVAVTIVRPDDSTTEGHVVIDSKAVDEIECDTCRAALTPRAVIRRAPLRRRTRLEADPAKQREWERRSRQRARETSKERARSRIGVTASERLRPQLDDEREYIKIRSGGLCEGNWPGVCPDGPHRGEHAHHVKLKGQGGPDTHDNLIWICRTVHEWIHAHPRDARERGLLRGAWA